MDDEYDIYGDLDGFEVEAQKENKIVKELNGEIKQLKEQITQTESEKEAIARKNEVLLENISSLLLTAKAELKRKDALIADIRREKDNVAFRRSRGAVKKHDKGTQTERVRTVHQEVQTDGVPPVGVSSGRRHDELRQDKSWPRRGSADNRPHTRERVRSRSRSRDRSRPGREKPRLSERLQKRLGWTKDTKLTRERSRERERERERRARRGPHSPEVRFHSPIRVSSKQQEVGAADSASDIDLVKGLIPMNRVELDRFVKEIGRKESRSPEGCYPGGGSTKPNTLLGLRNSDLWDGKQKTPMKPKIERKIPAIEDSTDENSSPVDTAPKKQEEIIQSDEIGTTGNGSTLSPEKSEELEQKMLALHGGEPPMVSIPVPPAEYHLHQTSAELLEGLNSKDSFDTSQPAKFVIPPPEPPIMEQVPEMPLDDDVKLNDSRELRIIESDEALAMQQQQQCEDERNSSAETVIEKNQAPPPVPVSAVAAENEEELEEGEVISATESEEEEPSKERHRTNATRTGNKIRQEDRKHRATDRRDAKNAAKKPDESRVSHRRRHSNQSHSEKPLAHKPDLSHSHKHPNISHPPLDTSTPNRSSTNSTISTRRSSLREKLSTAAKVEPKPTEPVRSSERQKSRTRRQSYKDLFGSDDENSPAKKNSPAKRKHSPEKEALVKKSKHKDSRPEQPLSVISAAKAISQPEPQRTLSQRETVKRPKVELVPETPPEETVLDLSEIALDKSEPCTEPPPITSTPLATQELQSSSDQVTSNTAGQEPPEEDPVINQKVDHRSVETSPIVSVPDNTANKEETSEEPKSCTFSSPEKPTPDPHTASVCTTEQNSISPQVITYSNKYSEYRIEVNNEVEATVYITRKKKKKAKSKGATPNTSVVDPV